MVKHEVGWTMRKRLLLILSILLLTAWSSAACYSQLKTVRRDSNGTATLTPFLVKATYTSESPPLELAGGEEIQIPSLTMTLEPGEAEETSQGGNTAGESPTATSTPTPSEDLPKTTVPSNTPKPTATVKPTKPPATAPPTSKPSKTPADTNTPEPPADTNTPQPPTATPTPGECVWSGNSGFENDVIDLINQERADHGLPALVKNASLTQAARRHSLDMACNDNWSHTGSDGSTLATRILEAGYSYTWAAENIAASSSPSFSPASVVAMWMNSTGHRANILSTKAVHIGIGFRYAGDVNLLPYDAYYTADFGRP